MTWIKCTDEQPHATDEYNVVWNLDEGMEPVVTTMEWCNVEKQWKDVAGFCDSIETDKVTHWQPLPNLPEL